MPVWVKYIGLAVLAYAAYCTLVFAFQRQMIFPRSLIGYAPVALPDNLPIEKIWLTIPGASVESWYIPPTGGPTNDRRPALIFAHGNAERIDLCIGELMPSPLSASAYWWWIPGLRPIDWHTVSEKHHRGLSCGLRHAGGAS